MFKNKYNFFILVECVTSVTYLNNFMKKKELLKLTVDNFLKKKNGRDILNGIEKKNLIKDGLIDSLDIFSLASNIEKKLKIKINISDNKTFKKFQKYKSLINL